MKTKILSLLLVIVLVLSFASCGQNNSGDDNDETTTKTNQTDPIVTNNEVNITFSGNKITTSSTDFVTVSDNVVTITGAGKFVFTGVLDNGRVVIAAQKTEKVDVVFNGVSITSATFCPFYIDSADKVSIELAAGSINTLTDSSQYYFPNISDTTPNACLYSDDDLSITGEGTLTVNGNYNNGIACKNDLKIKSGNLYVTAVKNAIKGNDSVTVTGGKIEVLNCKDGIKSDSTDAGEGIVKIEGGTVKITAKDDGIQAAQSVEITGGSITINAGDTQINCDGTVNIAEGITIAQN